VNLLKENTPDSLQYLVKDMFETITLYDNSVSEAKYKTLEDGRYEVTMNTNVSKYRSSEKGEKEFTSSSGDSLSLEIDGQEIKSLPLKDYIEVGVFGKKKELKNGVKKENVLYLKKHLITEIQNEFKIIVDELPVEAGIDPYNKLIDTNSGDNRMEVRTK
jgi:ABC-2 type transport system permease protein